MKSENQTVSLTLFINNFKEHLELKNYKVLMKLFLLIRTPLHHSDFVYNLTSAGRRFKKNSEIVGCKADEIIKKRRKALMERVIDR